jgi:drug/metabolite transporter (DMT)-like permease
MHATTGNWRRGFALSLTTAFCWGVLPIALKHLLIDMAAITVTWYRLATAGLALGIYLAWQRKLPALPTPKSRAMLLFVVATVCLAGNYVLYLVSLDLTTPTIAQIIGQVSPLCLLAGGLLVFGERLSRLQWLGVAALVGGLAVFFHDRLAELTSLDSRLGLGVVAMVAGSMVWATYALAQKQLLTHYGSAQVLMVLYLGSVPLLWPWSHPAQLTGLDATQLALLAFCCLNTLGGLWLVRRGARSLAGLADRSRRRALAAAHDRVRTPAGGTMARSLAAEPLTAVNVLGACRRGRRIDHVRARRRGGRANRCDAGDQPGRDSACSRRVNQASPTSSLAMGPDPTSALIRPACRRASRLLRAATWLRRNRRWR